MARSKKIYLVCWMDMSMVSAAFTVKREAIAFIQKQTKVFKDLPFVLYEGADGRADGWKKLNNDGTIS